MTMEPCGILGPSAPRAAVTDEADDRKEQAAVAIVAKGTRTCEFKPREEETLRRVEKPHGHFGTATTLQFYTAKPEALRDSEVTCARPSEGVRTASLVAQISSVDCAIPLMTVAPVRDLAPRPSAPDCTIYCHHRWARSRTVIWRRRLSARPRLDPGATLREKIRYQKPAAR